MTLTITLSADAATGAGVNFNTGYSAFLGSFTPYGFPIFNGAGSETTQIVHLDTPVTGQEARTKAVLLEGDSFEYTFSNHSVSGTIETVRLVRLGDAYDDATGELVLENGVVRDATPYITISGLAVKNAAGVKGPVHEIVAGLMGGGPDGTDVDPAPLTSVIWAAAHNVMGSSGSDTYVGTAYADVVQGLGGNDILSGNGGNDTLSGGTGNDTLNGNAGADRMTGGDGNDTFVVDSTADVAIESTGGSVGGSDVVITTASHVLGANIEGLRMVDSAGALNGTGNSGANVLVGTAAANTLRGLAGADTIHGANGADVLVGGPGADVFQFAAASASTPSARDIIRAGDGAVAFEAAGASLGDRFDFRAFDANTGVSGVQHFAFGASTGTARLWAVNSGTNTLIRGNVDADAAIEFELVIEDGATLANAYTVADFLLA